MLERKAVAMAALLVFGSIQPVEAAASPDVRPPFVIGAPGRLDAAGDRRQPRRYLRDDSAIGAYADIEEVEDPTWLRHEIRSYVRGAVDCAGLRPPWCQREVRRLGAARVIALAAGTQAELVWVSGGNLAVRLGWRRIVVTPAGSMTLDVPPEEFARALLDEFPSQIEAHELDAGQDAVWEANEVERLLYYAEQVVAALPAVVADQHRDHAAHFVEENLARIARVRAQQRGHAQGAEVPGQQAPGAARDPGELPPPLAEQLAAVDDGQAGDLAQPWCSALRSSSAALSLVAERRP